MPNTESKGTVDFTKTVSSLETIHEQVVHGASYGWLTFTVGTANLSDFDVAYKAHPGGSYATIATQASDYTSPDGPILGASGDLASASTSGTHWLHLDLRSVYSIRIQAAGTSSLIIGHFSWS